MQNKSGRGGGGGLRGGGGGQGGCEPKLEASVKISKKSAGVGSGSRRGCQGGYELRIIYCEKCKKFKSFLNEIT